MPSSRLTRAGDWLNTKLVTPVTWSGYSVRIDSSEERMGSWNAGSSTETPSGAWKETTTSPSASRPYASCSSCSAVAQPLSGSSKPPWPNGLPNMLPAMLRKAMISTELTRTMTRRWATNRPSELNTRWYS